MDKEKDKRSLYDEALDRFRKDSAERYTSTKDAELLREFLRERATPEETKRAAEALQGDAGKKWGGRKAGDVEIPESWIANIMGNIENFVAAGDFLTKNAPESVGMAWYAIKLTLTAIHSNYDLYTFFGTGLSDVSEIMIIVRHYDRLYDERSKPQWKPSPLVEKLFQDVIGAYAAVLDFCFAIKRHLTAGTVRHIQDFQDTQRKLHEDAMARFDVLLKGLDDIRASTKRKTQWDYAVQDFQTYQEALDPLKGSFRLLGDTIDAVYPGTCEWVFEDRLYEQWVGAADNAMLCITGSEGSGKSYVVASIANRINRTPDPDEALLYVACSGSTTSAGLGSNQSYTADSICRTLLSQLYDFAVQGEDNVGLLETCNGIFKKAKAKVSGLPAHMRSESDGLPEFADGFTRLAALLNKKLVLVLDGLDGNTLEDKDQDELLRKVPEQEAAKVAILEKAGSRFLYVRDTAIPFMLEPFQRPLSKRLETLPDGISDVYKKALSKMSPNYLDLLRTALTWTLLAPEFPGYPHAREIMDAFQGTYDFPAEVGLEDGVEAEFPVASRLELEQLRAATDPFLRLIPENDGRVWVFESDTVAVCDYFLKNSEDVQPEVEEHEHVCARCGSAESPATQLYIDPKQGNLQMALTCLRHLNNPLFQQRAGLRTAGEQPEEQGDADTEDASAAGVTSTGENGDPEPMDVEAEDEADGEKEHVTTVDDYLQEAQDGYATEDSVDDEDVIKPHYLDEDPEDANASGQGSEDEGPTRVRYEIQYWPWHLAKAEAFWPAEERENNEDWAALMKELDKFVFDTPEVFAAWQGKYPEKEDEYDLFRVAGGPHKALHVAAYLGLTTWTRHLLDRGEKLDELSEGYSPLQAAACSETTLDTVKMLLNEGADVNAENGVERSAFHLWLIRGDITLEGVQMLLDHGADVKVPCTRVSYSALQYFANRGEDPAILDLLLAQGADINAVHPGDDWLMPPLHVLLMRRDVPEQLLDAFIKHNADTNSENAASARPLQMISTNGQLENLKILLKSDKLEIDDTDFHGTTAVHEAAFFNYSKCVDALLGRGADPDITDKLNRVALHTAARKGFANSVRVLLKYTKQANLHDKQGWTPLFCACLSKDQESALLILDALLALNLPLSEINITTRSGRTVLRQAADHGFTTVVTRLLELGAAETTTTTTTTTTDTPSPPPTPNPALLLDTPDTKKGMTPLHRAAANGHATCVHLLLTAGANPSLPDTHSHTPLALAHQQWAINTKTTAYEDILTQLIDAAPAAAAADADLVAVCAANGSVSLLERLWRLHADLNRPDRYGWTPLALARQFGRGEAEGFLKRQAAWANLLPGRWETGFPGTTPLGAGSVAEGGRRVVHTSGKRVCVSADRPLPAGLERYYFEVSLFGEVGAVEGGKEWPEMAVGFCTLGGAALEFPGWWAASDSPSTARSIGKILWRLQLMS
ncbi:ankyrin repeat-containing domain protein [Chaetomium fimeti]|uniref:Ankyrin repeat-containing domain protein n=1 Tax=Chaetomium fimeti TaxID=1854472 RepID=A0AAE0H875_9PEZI|nr:ankyrin repeat-containing domain protein [Chaetomium fimeti]